MQLCVALNMVLTAWSLLILECNYDERPFTSLQLYTCNARLLQLSNTTAVYAVIGEHSFDKTNNDVGYLRILDQPIDFIPEGIKNFFPNLHGLRIGNSSIKQLNKDDLLPYPELELLSFDKNRLEVLDGDLFDYTPSLKWIYFEDNNIVHIVPDLLASLKNLEYVNFSGNICVDEIAESHESINLLTSQLSVKCPPTAKMIKDEVAREIQLEQNKIIAELRDLANRVKLLED